MDTILTFKDIKEEDIKDIEKATAIPDDFYNLGEGNTDEDKIGSMPEFPIKETEQILPNNFDEIG